MDRIEAAKELAFRVGFSGHNGHLRLEPLSTVERCNPLKSLPDFILVSILVHRHFSFIYYLTVRLLHLIRLSLLEYVAVVLPK